MAEVLLFFTLQETKQSVITELQAVLRGQDQHKVMYATVYTYCIKKIWIQKRVQKISKMSHF